MVTQQVTLSYLLNWWVNFNTENDLTSRLFLSDLEKDTLGLDERDPVKEYKQSRFQ